MVLWKTHNITLTGTAFVDLTTDYIILLNPGDSVVFDDIDPSFYGWIDAGTQATWAGIGVGWDHASGRTQCINPGFAGSFGMSGWDGKNKMMKAIAYAGSCDTAGLTDPRLYIGFTTCLTSPACKVEIRDITVGCNQNGCSGLCPSCSGYPNYDCEPSGGPCASCEDCDPATGCVSRQCGICEDCNPSSDQCEPRVCPSGQYCEVSKDSCVDACMASTCASSNLIWLGVGGSIFVGGLLFFASRKKKNKS